MQPLTGNTKKKTKNQKHWPVALPQPGAAAPEAILFLAPGQTWERCRPFGPEIKTDKNIVKTTVSKIHILTQNFYFEVMKKFIGEDGPGIALEQVHASKRKSGRLMGTGEGT